MGLAAVGNWLFNFAIGLFLPPAFRNITYKIFLIFGVLCFAAAVQAFFTYPETCQKTIEEIELLFSNGGPKPWHTKPGGSRLEAEIQAVIDRKAHGGPLYAVGVGLDDEVDTEKGNNMEETAQGKESE